MKIRRGNLGIGCSALLWTLWHPSQAKELLARTLECAYAMQTTRCSAIRPLSVNDDRIVGSGDVLLNMAFKKGNTNVLEQYILVSICKKRAIRTFFEIGTFDGQTSYALAKNLPELKICTLDLPASLADDTALPMSEGEKRYAQKQVVGKAFLGTAEAKRITQLLGDSARFDYRQYVGRMDCVFVDGCHDAVYVKNDTERAMELLTPNGMVLWHDYLTYDAVTRYLDALAKTYRLYRIEGTSLVMYCKDEDVL